MRVGAGVQELQQRGLADGAQKAPVRVDHRQRAGALHHQAVQLADGRVGGHRRHVRHEGVAQAQRAFVAAQRLAQRLGRHHAQEGVAGADHVAPFAVLLLQALQGRAAAARGAFGHLHLRLARDVAGLEHGGGVHPADEVAHVFVGRRAQDFLGHAHLHHLAVLHDGDAVADAHGLVQVVRDEDDGAALVLLQAQQLVLHVGADDRVERREGLVHQQNGRVGRQRARQAHALLHAARQLVGVGVGPHLQPHLGQRGVRLGQPRSLVHAGQLQPEGGVVQHRQVRQQREGLEHHADVLAAKGAQPRLAVVVDVLAVDQDAPGGGLDQAVDQPHQGGLARARQAHDDEDLAGLDGEAGVEHADRLAGLRHDVLLGKALARQGEGLLRLVAEDFEDVFDLDGLGHALFPCLATAKPDAAPRGAPARAARSIELGGAGCGPVRPAFDPWAGDVERVLAPASPGCLPGRPEGGVRERQASRRWTPRPSATQHQGGAPLKPFHYTLFRMKVNKN